MFNSRLGAGGPRADHRKSQRAQEFSGLAIIGLAVTAGLLLLFTGSEPYIPSWIWLALLCIALSCSVWPVVNKLSARAALMLYTTAVVSSWLLIATMPDIGMLVVLLILVAAAGVDVVPMWAVLSVVVMNCVMIAIHLRTAGAEPVDYFGISAFYFILHIAAVFSTYALSREAKLRGGLEEKTTQLEAASVLLEDSAKTAERLRISRELHDLIGHQLTILNLELEAAKHHEGHKAREHTAQAGVVAKELLANVRNTVGELRAAGPGNLRDALQRIASAVQSLDISVEIDNDVIVDEQQAEALVRAGQEIITNALKHSEAKELWIAVAQDDSGVELSGANDGPAPRNITLGNGLRGLSERVTLLGGQLSVDPYPTFTVTVTLPNYSRTEPHP